MTTEQRVLRLEEINQEVPDRLERLETRMDTQFRWVLGVTITLWSTTMLGVIATLLAILVKL